MKQDQDTLFLNTLMVVGPPPARRGLRQFKADGEHMSYYYRVVKFWRQLGCEFPDQWEEMAFYNTRFIPWLNRNETLGQ